jgi:hypothetical protein
MRLTHDDGDDSEDRSRNSTRRALASGHMFF